MDIWQPIETAPKDGTDIIGCWHFDTDYREGDFIIISWFLGEDGEGWHDGTELIFNPPILWAPIPFPEEAVGDGFYRPWAD
jgi:hypothetical protein